MPDPENKGGDTPNLDKILERLTAQQEAQANILASFGQSLQGLTGAMSSFQESLKNGLNVNPPKQPEPEFDFEKADVGSVAQFILKEVGKMMGTVKEEFKGEIDGLKRDKVQSERLSEYNKLKSEKGNEEVDEWLPEMKDLATNNPNLSMRQLLDLARTENREKADTLRAKREESDNANKPPEEDNVFGGLTPTSGKSFDAQSGGDKKKVDLKDAINEAWNKVVPDSVKRETSAHDPIF
jgi:hypothetical protein